MVNAFDDGDDYGKENEKGKKKMIMTMMKSMRVAKCLFFSDNRDLT